MLAKSLIKRMNPTERTQIKDGALALGIVTGDITYCNYREIVRKEFLRSEAFYRFSHLTENITPWK
jgi:hypothetical protein